MKKKKNKIICVVGFIALSIVIFGVVAVITTYNEPINQVVAKVTLSEEYTAEEGQARVESIKRIQDTSKDYSVIVVGDSVCQYLFESVEEDNPSYLFVGSSRPFTIAGQYVQIKEFIDYHPNAREVYMVEGISTWESILDTQGGYQQLMVPLIETETINDLDEETIDYAKHNYSSLFMTYPFAKMVNHSNVCRKLILNSIMFYHQDIRGEDTSALFESTPGEISPLNQHYLKKIIQLCEENNITLHIIHDPVSNTEQSKEDVSKEREMFDNAGYSDSKYADEYINSVLYYPEEYFVDGTHIVRERELENTIVQQMKDKTRTMNDLVIK